MLNTTKAKEEKEKLRKKVENWVRHLHHSKRATRDKEFYVKEVAVYHFLLKETVLAHQAGREEMKQEVLEAIPLEADFDYEESGVSDFRKQTINSITKIEV